MAVAVQSTKKESKPAAKAPEPKVTSPEPRREAVRSPLFLGGQPLPPAMRSGLESSFGVGLNSVRVHNDKRAQSAAQNLSSRAFTYGNAIFLGRNESPHDRALMGHEVAHVIQQQGTAAVQHWSPPGTDRFESEAHRASAAAVKGETFQVQERTAGASIQRLGVSDALDYFADKANMIPGFRMFTLVIGINPINMSHVERTTANVLRALVELIPLGGIISQVLDKYGVFDKVAAYIDGQLNSLGISGASIRAALDEFLDSLHWRDIFHLGDVWDRAVHIFSDPIHRIITFASNLVGAILRFVREAVLRPLAELAKGTAGWDLLKAVLGQDPITGDPVPRNADTLIGGFMKMIGHEEVWENVKKGKAVDRAWAWFQTALSELWAFVTSIPSLFIQALESLEIGDFIFLPNAFVKVGRVFGSFAGRFLSWGLKQVLSLLQIVVEVVAPGVMPYIQKAGGAFRTIVQNPIGFVGNLVRAGKQGFLQFASNFLTHLRTALIQWLTGTLSGAGVYIPQAFEIKEIIKFVLSVLGLTWQNIRAKLVKVVGETAVKAMETGFDLVVTLVRDGPAAAWDKIREAISNLREMVMEQIMTFVRERIVQAAITKLLTSLNPAGAFIQAIIATYNTIMFFVERLQQIGRVAMAFIDSIASIASGNIANAANRVEQTMAGLLTLVISFLARLVGLGKVSDAVVAIINKIREPIDRALDRVIEWIVGMARRVGRFVAQAGVPQDPNERLQLAGRAATPAMRLLAGKGPVSAAVLSRALGFLQQRYALSLIEPIEKNGEWYVRLKINPEVVLPSGLILVQATGSGPRDREGPLMVPLVEKLRQVFAMFEQWARLGTAPVAQQMLRLVRTTMEMASALSEDQSRGVLGLGPRFDALGNSLRQIQTLDPKYELISIGQMEITLHQARRQMPRRTLTYHMPSTVPLGNPHYATWLTEAKRQLAEQQAGVNSMVASEWLARRPALGVPFVRPAGEREMRQEYGRRSNLAGTGMAAPHNPDQVLAGYIDPTGEPAIGYVNGFIGSQNRTNAAEAQAIIEDPNVISVISRPVTQLNFKLDI